MGKAISALDFAGNIEEIISWWSDFEIVGSKGHNIVMILLRLSGRFDIKDNISMEERIKNQLVRGIPEEIANEALPENTLDNTKNERTNRYE